MKLGDLMKAARVSSKKLAAILDVSESHVSQARYDIEGHTVGPKVAVALVRWSRSTAPELGIEPVSINELTIAPAAKDLIALAIEEHETRKAA